MRIDPRLNDFLEAQGLGRVRIETTKEQAGRNSNFLLFTTLGHRLFVKNIAMRGVDSEERFLACLAFDKLTGDTPENSELSTARLVAHDEALGFLAYEAVEGAKSISELVADADGQQATDRIEELGSALAAMHNLDSQQVPARTLEQHMPPTEWLDVLPFRVYQNASAPALSIWQRLQADAEVANTLIKLRADERVAPVRAIHGDVRLDQFLVGKDDVLRVVDLEEFRRGDSARDVGAMVGEWLHRATLDLLGAQLDDTPDAIAAPELTHDEVLASGAAALDRRRPLIARLWSSYRAAGGGDDDPAFLDRVIRFAGWHMFDRLIAVSEHTSRISPLHWAAAGIGRQALLNPRAAAPALGLPDYTAINQEDAA